MQSYPIPVHMLSLCDTQGRMEPVRFRVEDQAHQLHTISIQQILSQHAVEYVGIEAMVYLCKVVMDGRERVLELRYTVRSHKWMLQRMVS